MSKSIFEKNQIMKLEHFVIDQDQKDGVILGKGSFATVYRAFHQKTKNKFAIKVINIDLEKTDSKELENIKREIKVQSSLNHPSIIKLYHHEYRENKVFLILELAEKGNLFNFLKNQKKPLQNFQISKMYKKICEGVRAVHNLGIVHRDIKPENILLDKDSNPKICDFGWSVEIGKNEKRGTFCGTYEYMAPEIYENEKYNVSVDVWSLGVLLYEMFHGFSPFSSKSVFKIYRNIVEEGFKFKDGMDEDAKELVKMILQNDPAKRPDLDAVLESTFIRKFCGEEVLEKKGCIQIQEFLKKKKTENKIIKDIDNLKTKRTNKKKLKTKLDLKKDKVIGKKKKFGSKKKKIPKSSISKKKIKTYQSNSNIYNLKKSQASSNTSSKRKMNMSISIESFDSQELKEKIGKMDSEKNLSLKGKKVGSKKSLYEIKKKKKLKSSYLNFKTFQSNQYEEKLSQKNSSNNFNLKSNKIIKKIQNKKKKKFQNSSLNINKFILSEKLKKKNIKKNNLNKSAINKKNLLNSSLNKKLNSDRFIDKKKKFTNNKIYKNLKKKIIKKNSYNEKNIKTVKNNEFTEKSRLDKNEEMNKNKLDSILKNFLKQKNIKKNSNKKKHLKQNSLNEEIKGKLRILKSDNNKDGFFDDLGKCNNGKKTSLKKNLLSSRN